MLEPATIVAIAVFLTAGAVKGVIGLGLPTVSLALLTVTIGLPQAMALVLMPAFVTNVWQAGVGGHGVALVRRTWPFLLPAAVMVGPGALALTRVDVDWLSGLLGLLLIAYAGSALIGVRLVVTPAQERWAGPITGAVNGVLTGMTGSAVVPGVLFLQAIGLPRDVLVQAMGMLFTIATLALAIALGCTGLLTIELGALSTAAVAPALVGMVLGRHLRQRLSEARFRKVFFVSLLALGGYIVVRSLS